VPPSGYAWWYIDGLNDDHSLGITIIGFVGSVFSPNYFFARKSVGQPDPLDFSAFNIAVYGGTKSRWAFTEEPRSRVERSSDFLQIGNNRMIAASEGEMLIEIDEHSPKFHRRIRGTVRLKYNSFSRTGFYLDRNRRHAWHPIVPVATIEVNLVSPEIRFIGSGYLDMNFGEVPLETDFSQWCWSRHALPDKTFMFYDGTYQDGAPFSIAAFIDGEGILRETEALPNSVALPDTRLWKCPRRIRSEGTPRVFATLENSPFYARTAVETTIEGRQCMAMHESLRLDRFVTPWVQRMLPFRLRRNS
jgi:carotenoid 1,2-hydratase